MYSGTPEAAQSPQFLPRKVCTQTETEGMESEGMEIKISGRKARKKCSSWTYINKLYTRGVSSLLPARSGDRG